MSQNIIDESQTTTEQPTSAALIGKTTEAIGALIEAQEHLVAVAKDVAKHTTDPNAHGAATLANIAKAMPTPVLEDGMFTFKDAAGKPLMEPVNIKGDPGEQGEKGEDGEKGEMPDHRWNGTSLQLQKPDGSWGEAQDLKGEKGEPGTDGAPGLAPAHEWDGTSLKFKNPDGTWGDAQNLQGPKGQDGADGIDGATGPMPDHRWNGTSLQLQKPDGSWGEAQDLKGDPGDATIAGIEQPVIKQPDGITTTVDEDGIFTALGGNLLLNDDVLLTESGTFTAPVDGWYSGRMWSGGTSGNLASIDGTRNSGCSGCTRSFFIYLHADQEVPFVIGAGGHSPAIGEPGNSGGETHFGDIVCKPYGNDFPDNSFCGLRESPKSDGLAFLAGAGLCGGFPSDPATYLRPTQEKRNADTSAGGCYGGGGAVSVRGDVYGLGAGAQGSIYLAWHNRAKAAGPLPEPALLSGRRMASRAATAPVTVNLYDPETGQGSVWREEDAPAKLAEGLITEEAWREICAARAAEAYAAWLADPETLAERFALLRAARKLKLADYDVAMAELRRKERAGADVTADLAAWDAYAEALCDLPEQEGAPWDGGGELTPWPEMPTVEKVQVQPDEPEQTEEPEV